MSGAVPDRTSIQRIRADQGLLLRALRIQSLTESQDAFGQPLAEARERPDREWHRSARRSSRGDSHIWLFALRGDEALGLIQGRKRRPATLLLFSMWIESRVRRQGLGRLLIEALEEWAHSWNATQTVLWVYERNHSAIRFYRDLGFETVDAGEDAESGARFEAIAMERLLSRSMR
ncbi:MAG: GNAT family N-acetyltransferase [Chloroflexota bacterium]